MLKQWNAIGFRGVLANGRTKPLVIDCIEVPESVVVDLDSPTPERKEFVVKAIGNPEVDASLIIRELLGNLLARSYGLATPQPGLIRISETFANAINPMLKRDYGFQVVPGIGAGCEYLRPGFTPPPLSTFFTQDELASLALLYGFDSVTQNPDRLPLRPNFGLIGKRPVAFDFDQCFSFLYLIFSLGEPWEVSKHGIAQKHFCHSALKNAKNGIDWKENIDAVMSFSEQFLEIATSWIPEDWADSTMKIKAHLLAIRDHLGAFEIELQGSVQ